MAGAFGVKGEVRITTFTGDPMALVRYRDLVRADGTPALTLVSGRPVKGGLVARVREVGDRNQAEALRGLELHIPRKALPAPEEDEFYLVDLIGLAVRDGSGETVGSVKSVEDFGAGDLLEIAPSDGGATWWLPFTKEAVPEIRIADGWIVVEPPGETQT